MKKVAFIFLTLFAYGFSPIGAQVNRGLWDFGPVITTTNNGYGFLGENVKMYLFSLGDEQGLSFMNKNRWWIPTFRSRFDIVKNVHSPLNNTKTKWADWGIRSFSAGYHIGYISYVNPFGFDFQVDYERQNWRLKPFSQREFIDYAKQMLAPTFLLRVRIGDFTKNRFNMVVDGGARYNYAFHASGDYDDVESLDNGFTGVFGIGLVNPTSHCSVVLRYEHDFYDYFNVDYSPDGIVKPYDGVTTTHGSLNLLLSFAF